MYKITDTQIRELIERKISEGFEKFAIFPFGSIGVKVKEILVEMYGIYPEYLIDNNLSKYNKKIISLDEFKKVNVPDIAIIIAKEGCSLYLQLKNKMAEIAYEDQIAEFSGPKLYMETKYLRPQFKTEQGRYNYGPLSKNHALVESVGSFCSFAEGVNVVANHPMNFVTTHPMLYCGKVWGDENCDYTLFKNEPWYISGVEPHDDQAFVKKTIIGNDVWLGRNVTILKGVKIGNGVIAGANSFIDRDVPDYAIVVGSPARIVRMRFTEEQIEQLNIISWWDWSDEKIRECFDDFYLPIDEFIEKHIEDK